MTEPTRELTVGKVVGRGFALAHTDGATWLVDGALPGETVTVVERVRRRGVVEAAATALLSPPHPARCRDPCRHRGDCGGCDWAHVELAAGARLKAEVAAETARSFPALAALLRRAPVTASAPAYRLRSRLHWAPEDGRLGFFARSSHRVADVADCRIVSPALAAARPLLERALSAAACPAGELAWLEDLAGARAVVGFLASTAAAVPPLPASALPALVSGAHRLAASGRVEDGWGESEVVMDLPRPLAVPVGCFVQVNRHLLPWLFERLGELAGAEPLPTWDLHGGVGFLAAATLAARASAMTVVEPHPPAAAAARRNLPEARVVARTAEAFLARAGRLPRAALVITDPPRAGLSAELRRQLVAWRPRRLLTMACDPGTWARDAAFLLAHGYRLAHLELVDLFPSTHHVELLAVLESE